MAVSSVTSAHDDDYYPWHDTDTLAPASLATELKTFNQGRYVLFVGFPALYKGAHIPKAKMAGPASKPAGIDHLKEEVKNVPHEAEIIIYCGCCPFVRCPNVRPAYTALKEMGYSNIKVLKLNTNLHTDWVEKGYPIELSTK
jgi:rhodanese-related sulfurtransferase